MRDKTEGMELFFATPALMGAGRGHSRRATQVDPTRATSRQCPLCTVVVPLGLPGWALPSSAHTLRGSHTEDPCSRPSSPSSSVLWERNSGSLSPYSRKQRSHQGRAAGPPRQAPPTTTDTNFSWLQVVKQRPSLLPGCGGSSELGGTALAQAQVNPTLSYSKNCPRKPFLDQHQVQTTNTTSAPSEEVRKAWPTRHARSQQVLQSKLMIILRVTDYHPIQNTFE